MAKIAFKAPQNKVVPDDTECRLNIFDVELKEPKAGGEPYLNWTILVAEGEYVDHKFWYITSLKPSATFGLKRLLDAVGCEYSQDDEGNIEFDTDDVVGQQITAILGVKEWQQQPQQTIKKIVVEESESE